MFTWMMIFVTHFFFRRAQHAGATASTAGAFRMPGFPASTLLGAALMAALIVTTGFTAAFRSTLEFGLPFLGIMLLAYAFRYRR
jgi:L-asparagine transporter-like permease